MSVTAAEPVAILAGSGRLPLELSDHLTRSGRAHRILAFRGFADREVRRRADSVVDLLDVKAALAWLDRVRPSCVTLAGAVSRPSAGAALNAYAWLRNRAEVSELLARGDDHVLRAVIALIEDRGYRIAGAHELNAGLLASPGRWAGPPLSGALEESLATGLSLLDDLSPYDVGQAAVVVGHRVLGIEGPEGTDRLLARVAALRRPWPWSRPARDGILVKRPKSGQDLRVDLPAIGPRTLRHAARAGLAAIAVAAGGTLVLDRARCDLEAERLGMSLVGVPWEAAA